MYDHLFQSLLAWTLPMPNQELQGFNFFDYLKCFVWTVIILWLWYKSVNDFFLTEIEHGSNGEETKTWRGTQTVQTARRQYQGILHEIRPEKQTGQCRKTIHRSDQENRYVNIAVQIAFPVLFRGGRAWFYSGGGVRGFIRGACVVLFRGGMRGFIRGGVRGFIQGGHAWFYPGGACVVLFGGACVVLFGGGCMVFPVFSDTMRYGQWAGGTHPTGMHSCFHLFLKEIRSQF